MHDILTNVKSGDFLNSPEPGSELSHYRLLDKIGEGGMGVVYRALDTRLNRHVAVKILRPELTADPARQQSFLREARAAAAVNHPGIATVHEIDESGGVTFIVMELVRGRTLGSVIAGRPLPVADAVHFGIQVADAMARAHETGVIHRDLKPENIFVEDDRRVRILDFGLAKFREQAGTGEAIEDGESAVTRDVDLGRRLLGTVSYMSPEQARGEEVDARSDIFSFGITLYEMLAGRRPFVGANVTATLARILESEPEPLARLRPGLPPRLLGLVDRCLRKNPSERFASAALVASELRESGRDIDTGATGVGGVAADARATAPVSKNTIAVFPFSFKGNQEYAYLSAGLVDLLSTKLDGAGELRSVDPHVILCCVSQMDPGVIDPEAARAAGRRYGAGSFVLGSVLELGGQLHLEASLYDATVGSKVVSKAAVRGEAASIFEMVDRLTAELLSNRPGGPGVRLARIAAVATDSFPALKAYLEGETEMRAMRRLTAVESYRRAVSHDASFALAWYRLSVAAMWSGQSHVAHEAAGQAVAHDSRLSSRDRDLLAAFGSSLRGDNDEAEARYRAILGAHPDDVEAWYQLGELQMHSGPLRGHPISGSREAWQRLVALDPSHVNGWAHLGLLAAGIGDTAALEHSIDRVLELSPAGDSAAWVRAVRAYSRDGATAREAVKGDLRQASDHGVLQAVSVLGAYAENYAGAYELAGLLTEPVRSAEVRALGHVIRACFDTARGRWSGARRELDMARSMNPAMAALHQAHLAAAPFLDIPVEALRSIRDQVAALPPGQAPTSPRAAWIGVHDGLAAHLGLYLEGLLDVRLGRAESALAAAGRMNALDVPRETGSLVEDLIISLRAHAAWAAGDAARALSLLDGSRRLARFDLTIWSPFYSQSLSRYLRAELLDRLGRREEALSWFESFGGNSIYEQFLVAPSHLRRGEILERLGRRAEAAGHYERFAALWRECDDELRNRVVDAGVRAARLRA